MSIDMKCSNRFTIDECTWCKQLGTQACRQRIKGGFGNTRYSHRPMKSDQFRSFLNRYMYISDIAIAPKNFRMGAYQSLIDIGYKSSCAVTAAGKHNRFDRRVGYHRMQIA